MRITILNGNPKQENVAFDSYLEQLQNDLLQNQHQVSLLTLRDLSIQYCTGCWSCWVKTPGRCIAQDDSDQVCQEYIHSNLVVFASPIMMGFTSALLKKINDKLIPLLHPYIEIVQGECHHEKRYDHYPNLALLLQKEMHTDAEDIKIISNIYRRLGLNLKSELSFIKFISDSIEEVTNEVNRI